MTAPLCPVHKRPGRYVFGSMVVCDLEDAELKAAKAPVIPKGVTVVINGIVREGAIVTVAPPRAPQVGDRVRVGGQPIGHVDRVDFTGRFVTVKSGPNIHVYDIRGLTFEPPVTP